MQFFSPLRIWEMIIKNHEKLHSFFWCLCVWCGDRGETHHHFPLLLSLSVCCFLVVVVVQLIELPWMMMKMRWGRSSSLFTSRSKSENSLELILWKHFFSSCFSSVAIESLSLRRCCPFVLCIFSFSIARLLRVPFVFEAPFFSLHNKRGEITIWQHSKSGASSIQLFSKAFKNTEYGHAVLFHFCQGCVKTGCSTCDATGFLWGRERRMAMSDTATDSRNLGEECSTLSHAEIKIQLCQNVSEMEWLLHTPNFFSSFRLWIFSTQSFAWRRKKA